MLRVGARWFSTSQAGGTGIVGGGVIGSSIAYFLAKKLTSGGSKLPPGRVTVFEADPTYKHASSALSAGSIRHQFSTPENIQIGQFGSEFLRHVNEHLSVDGECSYVNFVEGGYLFLAASQEGEEVLRANHATQRRLGAEISLLSPSQLQAKFPYLNVSDLRAGCLGERGEGWFDPYSLMMAFRKKAQSLGVEFRQAEVTAIELSQHSNRLKYRDSCGGVGELSCHQVVNAAGPRARKVAAMVGLDLPVFARKRCIFLVSCQEPVKPSPLVIDPTGVYWRPEQQNFICGVTPEVDPDISDDDFTVDCQLFEEVIWPAMANRVPAFECLKMQSCWAGHYEYNTFDQNAIVGEVEGRPNFFLANGFSGHGIQQSPAVGRAMAELLLEGRFQTLDLTAFNFRRIRDNKPIVELNVV